MILDGTKLVLVGGAGLIGSHTVDRLLKEDVREVVIYDNFVRGRAENLEEALKDPRVRIYDIGGDILQTDILESALDGVDGVFHFAALWLLQCHEFPRSAFDVNVRGTFNVMESCVKKGVKRLVYSSSASVYGDAVTEPMTEDHPFNNQNFYGATKIAGEAMLRAFHYRYGLDFVAVEDCALANVRAMQASTSDRFYNVGTGRRTSLKELAELLIELTGSEKPINYAPRSTATLVRNRIGSPKRAAEEIDFTAQIDLREGLEKLIAWRASHKAEVEARRQAMGVQA